MHSYNNGGVLNAIRAHKRIALKRIRRVLWASNKNGLHLAIAPQAGPPPVLGTSGPILGRNRDGKHGH
jgi:hypothetical protein